ncbi:MAG: hypothetical protein KY451_04510 [Actinobacteria bacterium]|nr:hypothetical protein [Actinomycetota bacterium]
MYEVVVLTWRELIAVCGTADLARAAVADGLYRSAALRRVLPESAVFSHWAALWALGLDVLPRDRACAEILDVTVGRGLRLQAGRGFGHTAPSCRTRSCVRSVS